MRRGVLIAAAIALALTAALWFAATIDRSPLHRERSKGRRPAVLAGRDKGEDAEAPVRVEGETAEVRCSYRGDNGPGVLVAVGPEAVSGNGLSLALPPGSWNILWKQEKGRSVNLGTIDAEPDEVYTCRLTDGGYVVDGTVSSKRGGVAVGVDVSVCGDRVKTNSNGQFNGVARIKKCIVRASYTDGLLTRRGEAETVEAFESHDLALVVDDTPIAGMGIAFRMVEGGARVTGVHADTPAEEAGLQEGDTIVKVNGTATSGLGNDAFVALGTGEEDTLLALEIDRGGELKTLSFRRKRLASSEDTGE